MRLRFERIGNRDLAAVCVVEAGTDGLFRFRIQVEGESGTIVERVDYPLLPLAAPLEGDGAGDALVLGTTKGGVLERPHQWKPGRSAAGTQPGNLAAQFGCYYGPKGGVVTYCEDGAGHPKTLGGRADGGRHGPGLASPDAARLEGALRSWRSPWWPACFAEREGPRPTGATRRRSTKRGRLKQPWCAKRLAERDDLPSWLKEGPAQVRFGREWLGQPERIEAWLEKYWAKHFEGVPLIVTFWGWEGVATWVPPQYFPPYPSEEGLETLRRCGEACRRARLLLAVGIPVVPQLREAGGRFVRMGRSGVVRARGQAARDDRQGREGHAHQSAVVSRRRGGDALPRRQVVARLAHRNRRGVGESAAGNSSKSIRWWARRCAAGAIAARRGTATRRASASGTSRPRTGR